MDNAPPYELDPPTQLALALSAERRDRGGLRRVRDVRFAEIAYRGWKEAATWLERVAPIDPADRPEGLLRRCAPDLAAPGSALRLVRDQVPGRFFAGITDAARFLGDARFEEPCDGDIDWHFDPVRGCRMPLIPWSRFDQLADAPGGAGLHLRDLNRQQWVVRQAQAWRATGDDRYADACVRAVASWIAANPPGIGINWVSSAEVSFRLISWCWVLALLGSWPALPPAWTETVLASIWLHASRVRRYLSHGCSPNNGLASEALALFYASTVFPEFRDADQWRSVAVRLIAEESGTQVHADGVHFEQSTSCHRYAAETFLQYILLAERNRVPVPAALFDRLRRMMEFLLAIRRPDGTIPILGDDDGGSALPLGAPRDPACRGLFAVAAAIFRRRDFAWAAGSLGTELPWLMGADGVAAFKALRPAAPAAEPSRIFPSGGYAVMRSGWEQDAHQMIVDVGPLGSPVGASRGHADLLSLQCSIFGETCLVDPGTGSDADGEAWRRFFRGTGAHSTLVVDGVSQAEPAGRLGWTSLPRVRLREWHSTPDFDFLDAEHDGYRTLVDPVSHRRRVIFVKAQPGYWIVVDDLAGRARHQVDVTFQFAPMTVTLEAHPWARAQTPGGPVLWISSFPSAPVHPSVRSGQTVPISGWVCGETAAKHAAPLLNYSFTVALPWRIVTLLLPDRQAAATPPAVRAIYDEAGVPAGVSFERPRRVVRFDDRAVSVERE